MYILHSLRPGYVADSKPNLDTAGGSVGPASYIIIPYGHVHRENRENNSCPHGHVHRENNS